MLNPFVQCQGSYRVQDKAKGSDTDQCVLESENLLNDCFGKESTIKSLIHTLMRIDYLVKQASLANFYGQMGEGSTGRA